MADAIPADARDELARLRAARDRKLAALGETYHPRMRAIHDELQKKRDAVWSEYDAAIDELRAAA